MIDVAIPSVGLSPHLGTLVAQLVLGDEAQTVRLYDNSPDGALARQGWPPAAPDYGLHEMPGASLYAEWNHAAAWSAAAGDLPDWGPHPHRFLAILNDDIRLPYGALSALEQALVEHPEYGLVSVDWAGERARVEPGRLVEAHGTRAQGGISGWAFMVRPEAWQPIDERLRVWYGDDMLVHSLWANQWKVGRLTGVVVEHTASTTVNALPWVPEAIAEDTELWQSIRQRYGA